MRYCSQDDRWWVSVGFAGARRARFSACSRLPRSCSGATRGGALSCSSGGPPLRAALCGGPRPLTVQGACACMCSRKATNNVLEAAGEMGPPAVKRLAGKPISLGLVTHDAAAELRSARAGRAGYLGCFGPSGQFLMGAGRRPRNAHVARGAQRVQTRGRGARGAQNTLREGWISAAAEQGRGGTVNYCTRL